MFERIRAAISASTTEESDDQELPDPDAEPTLEEVGCIDAWLVIHDCMDESGEVER